MNESQDIDPGAPKELDDGRYIVKTQLGSGGHAQVYLCFDQDQRQRVAAKILTLSDQEPEVSMLSFEREVNALEGLSHRNIVPLIRHFIDPGTKRPTLILEHIVGGITLHQLLLKANSISSDRKELPGIKWRLERLVELLSALDTAHRAGVIHRDLKPSNLLYDEDNDTFKIVDFGIARVLANYSQKSVAGDTLRRFYTEPFAAPEQHEMLAAQAPADLHAFGVLMVSLLGGCALKKTFNPRDPDQLESHLQPLKDVLGATGVDLYERLSGLISRLVRVDYGDRATLPEVERVLKDAILGLTDKKVVRIDLLPSARQKLVLQGGRELGENNAEILKDINDGLRVIYDPQDSGPVMRLYGRRIYAVARQDRHDPEQLVVFHAELPEENVHRNRQHQAKAAPFRIELGRGDGLSLLEFAHGQYLEAQAEKEEVRKRKDLFQVAQAMLKVQRQQLLRVEVHCALIGQRADHTAYGNHEYMTVRVEGVTSGSEDGDDAADHGLEGVFLEGLDEKTSFDFGERRLGHFHSYDATRRLLNIKLIGKLPKLPDQLTLVAYNAASEASFKRQDKALRLFYNKQTFNPRLAQLLVYPDSNSIGDFLPRPTIQKLDPPREIGTLVSRIMAARDLFVLQGPPGTGKTAIIAETVAQLLMERPNARILVASQANEAVNNAFDALESVRNTHNNTWRMYRDVSRHREDQDSQRSFDSVFKAWADETRKNVISAYEMGCRKKEWSTDTGAAIHEILTEWARNLERIDDVRTDYANSVHIVGATCMRVPEALRRFTQRHFDWVIVDEAAKATSAEVLVSIVQGRKFLLVGDHRQLPPYIPDDTVDDLIEMGIDAEQVKKSLFEHLYETINSDNRYMLHRQRRMHSSIAALVSEIAYRDRPLETAIDDNHLNLHLSQYNKDDRIFWIDVHKGTEEQLPNSRSFYNKEEVSVIEEILEKIEQEASLAGVTYTVGVIAPYGSQIERLRERVQPGSNRWKSLSIDIDTVDAFQGKQKAIIIYSTTRTSRHNWKFVADTRRLNVALSRAQRLVLIVGHYQHAHHSPNLAPILTKVAGTNNVIRKESM